MEDRKRPSPHDQNDSAPPSKRLATTANGAGKSHPDAEMPWKDDLERFQKDAIYRQMQEYRREKNTLNAHLEKLQQKSEYHNDHLRVLDSWFKQMIDEVLNLLPDPAPSTGDHSPLPSSLLFADHETFEKHLRSRSKDITAVITRLFGRFKGFSPEITEMQTRVSQLLATEKVHLVELERHQTERKELQDRLESASLRYMMAEKKLDRARSITVAKLEKQAILGAQKGEDGATVKREDTATNGAMENGDTVAELEESNHKALAVSQKQKEQLEKMEAENSKLTAKITELTTKSAHSSEDDYANTDLFKQVKSQHEDVIKRINHLEALNIQLQEEAVKLQAERTSFKSQVEAEAQVAIGEKEALLSTAETTVVRIRSNRDEVVAEQAIKRYSPDEERESLRKARELAAANEERIKALELENERLRSDSGMDGLQSDEVDAMSSDDLRTRYLDLDRKYNMLNSELSSMSTAFQRASKIASQKVSDLATLEEKVSRLTAEKAKADQKFFAAMKSKETRDAEVRTLRMQNTKSSDVVSQLKESEAASRSLLANLEKQLSETKDALTTKTHGHRSCLHQVTENGVIIEGLKGQISELKKSLTAKDTSSAATGSSYRKMELEVEEMKVTLAETKKSLESWKNKGLGNQSSEYEMLRTLAICTVCRKNFKDTAIKTCGHVFCKDCVEERLTSRSRKCPNCNKSFGSNDHMKITL